jgi:metallophosphoesterase (TIGR00282 family)
MKVLIFWDVYGRIWRRAMKKELPRLKDKYNPDFIVVNIENTTSGRWPIEKHILEFEEMGVDVMTSGDHIFDNFDRVKDYLWQEDSKLIRAANFYNDDVLEWKWYKILEKNSKKLLVIHLLWETFMKHKVDNPFLKADKILKKFETEKFDWIIIDFHKEVTPDWYWLWFFLDSRVSFIFWTHTHIQTNDELILEWGTGIISDVWMNWPLYSVIWADYRSVKNRFLTWILRWRIEQCLDKNYVINWVCVEIGDDMKCENIEKIRIRSKL